MRSVCPLLSQKTVYQTILRFPRPRQKLSMTGTRSSVRDTTLSDVSSLRTNHESKRSVHTTNDIESHIVFRLDVCEPKDMHVN